MAAEKLPLTIIIYSPTATDELHGIWRWNAQRYNVSHADAYLRFIEESIAGLARDFGKGKPVPTRPGFRYFTIRRRSRGHGHVVVYNHNETELRILHVFHTAQDWQHKVAQE